MLNSRAKHYKHIFSFLLLLFFVCKGKIVAMKRVPTHKFLLPASYSKQLLNNAIYTYQERWITVQQLHKKISFVGDTTCNFYYSINRRSNTELGRIYWNRLGKLIIDKWGFLTWYKRRRAAKRYVKKWRYPQRVIFWDNLQEPLWIALRAHQKKTSGVLRYLRWSLKRFLYKKKYYFKRWGKFSRKRRKKLIKYYWKNAKPGNRVKRLRRRLKMKDFTNFYLGFRKYRYVLRKNRGRVMFELQKLLRRYDYIVPTHYVLPENRLEVTLAFFLRNHQKIREQLKDLRWNVFLRRRKKNIIITLTNGSGDVKFHYTSRRFLKELKAELGTNKRIENRHRTIILGLFEKLAKWLRKHYRKRKRRIKITNFYFNSLTRTRYLLQQIRITCAQNRVYLKNLIYLPKRSHGLPKKTKKRRRV